MKTINVKVVAYVSTMQEIEVPDDFDVTDTRALDDLAYDKHLQDCLRNNAEDCISENSEVVLIEDENYKTIFEKDY